METLPPTASPSLALACPSCGQSGTGRYCAACGEARHAHRITVAHLLHEVFHLFTHVEQGFLYTLRELLLRPGTTQARYLAGQRARFQKPFSAFFVACTVTALGQFALKSLLTRWYGVDDDSTDFFRHYFSLLQVGLLPLYTLVAWAFFRRQRYNYAEWAVITAYSLSLLLYGALALNLLRLLWPSFDTKYVELPLIVVYNTLTYWRLFPAEARGELMSKSLLINTACFALSNSLAELVVAYGHHG